MPHSNLRSKNPAIILCLTLLSLIILIPALSCSKKKPVESTPSITPPVTISVTPLSGPPLTSVSVQGISPSSIDPTDTYALINGAVAPLFVTGNSLTLTIPVIVDSATLWIDTSITSMSLAIIKGPNADTIAFGANIFTLEALPKAPGSTAQMLNDWQTISTSLQTISQVLGGAPGVEEQIFSSFLIALDSVLNSSNSLSLSSLTARLTSGNPAELELFDAVFGSSGAVEQSQEYALLFSAMADSAVAIFGVPMRVKTDQKTLTLSDRQLAYMMQFYVVVREFGRTVIKPTAQTYSVVMGVAGLITAVPLGSIISACLSMIDFIVNKFVISSLPAKIDSLRIEVSEDTIFVGGHTSATMTIYTANDPQVISLQDVISQILTGLGYANTVSGIVSPAVATLKSVLIDFVNFMLGIFRTALGTYDTNHPEVNLDVVLGTLPQLRWQAQITNTQFVDVKTRTPDIMVPVPGEVNWMADSTNTGEGRIYATTATGSDATVIPQPPGFGYSAGAFGEDVAAAPTISIWSLNKLALVIEFSRNISPGGSNVLGVMAGHIDAFGDTTFEAGIRIDLTAYSGSADPETGFTDGTGHFNSVITIDPLSDTVSVRVFATDMIGFIARETVVARTRSSRIAFFSTRDGNPGLWSINPNDTADIFKIITLSPPASGNHPGSNLYWSRDSKWLVFRMESVNGPGIYSTNGISSSYQRTIINAASYGVYVPNAQSWFSGTPNELMLGAYSRFGSVSKRGLYIADASSGGKTYLPGTFRVAARMSPDDQTIAFTWGEEAGVYIATMSTANPTFGNLTNLVGPLSTAVGHYRYLAWSEDGSSLIYSIDYLGASYQIMQVDANGANDRLVASGSEQIGAIAILPTKDAIVFASGVGVDKLLTVVNLSGGTPNLVPSGFHNIVVISPSPDGESVVFDHNLSFTSEIFKVNLITNEETRLSSDGGSYSPAWSGTMQQ